MFLYRRWKKKSAKSHQSTIISDYQIENIPKLSYNFVPTQQILSHQNYYTNMPQTIIVPVQNVYQTIDGNYYSDISLSSSSTLSQSRSGSRYNSQDRSTVSAMSPMSTVSGPSVHDSPEMELSSSSSISRYSGQDTRSRNVPERINEEHPVTEL